MRKMAPTILSSSNLFLAGNEPVSSAEPVQIISKPGLEHNNYQTYQKLTSKPRTSGPHYKWDIVWKNVLVFVFLHSTSVYGLWLLLSGKCLWRTSVFCVLYTHIAGLGITAGAHRLWAHRTYKAKLPLRIFLMLCQSAALQNHIYEWVRDHRVHHKFTDSDADPHNSRRGFFFSHIGWLMVKKHKEVFVKGKTVDLSDLLKDSTVRFQMKYYIPLVLTFCFALPIFVPWYFWNETLWNSVLVIGISRYTVSLNFTWLVNSAAHIWGTKPYDKTINPTENRFVSVVALGEGWHNYHHIFPWDYKAAELGNYRMNFTTAFLDLMSKIGWAYDLKTVSPDIVEKRVKRTGDGSRINSHQSDKNTNNNTEGDEGHHHGDYLWGWGDADMKEKDKEDIRLFNNLKEE